MGNTHDTEIARIEADHIETRWRTTNDYRWGYVGDRGMALYFCFVLIATFREAMFLADHLG